AEARPGGAGVDIARAAASFVGDAQLRVDGESYRMDCSGLVEAALAKADLPRSGSSAMLRDEAAASGVLHHRRLPRPGDIAFFDDTYDRNDNGLLDDPLSHSAVVERVFPDGTVEMVHVGSKGVVRLRMNLRHPARRENEAGDIINDYLRQSRKSDPPGTRYLAGELWNSFASFYELPPLASEE
ncbi:MAG: hypothetical protein FJ090_09545, partial [Deltaproteobacteria bacterium]|nr:hypothetical protein [Deltaproteobacteria bacterium]